MIGARLKSARAKAGLSLRDLEEKIGNQVSAQAIGKYERDEMMPSSRVLIALAEALDVTESYLMSPQAIELEGVEFRKNRLTNRREEASVEASVLSAVERYLQIEDLLAAASASWSMPTSFPFRVKNYEDDESAARRLRQVWELGLDAIPSFSEFLEEQGIKVITRALESAVSGLMCFVRRQDGGRVPVIVINEVDSGERQRFTLAHELGHLILEVDEELLDEEKAAQRFAGAFLMPAEVLYAEVGQRRSSVSMGELFALKRLYGVSVQAIAYRCKDLGILTQKAAGQLYGLFTKQGWRSPPYPEPQPIAKEKPQRFRRLCFRALSENLISESKAAELLEVTVRALGREMDEGLAPS
jgi:Zn-dependent peptidase ImmA (M78 family)/DNA-binding XRE family transcriptional regulator